MTSKLKLLVASAVIPAVFLNSVPAFAAGTTQGTSVQNNVSVAFQVGGVSQTAATGSDTFAVDRKVIFTVAEKAPLATTTVAPGQNDAIVTYTVTNSSNDVLDFGLTVANITGGSAPRGTDNIDASNLEICVDADENGTCSGTGAETWGATGTIDNLGADITRTVFVRGDFGAVTNGQIAGARLTATAQFSSGTAFDTTGATGTTTDDVATDSTVNTAGVETIFADVVGTNDNTVARNGIVSTLDDYTVGAANLSVVKYSRVVSDGVSATNPKAIPGAVVEYCIAVSNAASAATATNITVTDNLTAVAGTTYQASFTPATDGTVVNAGASTCTPGAGTGTYSAGTDTVSGTLTDIAAGQTRTLVFRVTID